MQSQPSIASSAGSHFSAIIVNYDGGTMLTAAVRSVLREGIPPAEIFVIDNGSRDGSIRLLGEELPSVTGIQNPCNAGFARAVNQGLVRATGELILLLNNDAELFPGALAAFQNVFHAVPQLAIAGGQLRYPDGRLQNAIDRFPTLISEVFPDTWLQLLLPRRYGRRMEADQPVPVDSVVGACLAVRRSILPQLGLLDEEYFFFWEETEWCQRARRLGMEVYHVPGARAMHLQATTSNRFRGSARVEYQRSQLTFYRKTRSAGAYRFLSLWIPFGVFVNALGNGVLCLLTGFAVASVRERARVYGYLLAWHLRMRPASWGLPDKCPPGGSEVFQKFNASSSADAPGSGLFDSDESGPGVDTQSPSWHRS